MKSLTRVCFFLCLWGAAQAQDEAIVLSPFTVSSDKASTKPPVVLKRRADFLLLEISLVNDTREEERHLVSSSPIDLAGARP